MRTLFGLLLAALLGCSSLTRPPAPVGMAQTPTVEVLDSMAVALVDDEGKIHCSGTWVGKGLVLTAAHCIKEDPEAEGLQIFWVRSNPGEGAMPAFRLKIDTDGDLGLLAVADGTAEHGAAMLGPMPAVGDGLLSLNNTFGMENSFMRGYVGGYQENDGQIFLEAMLPGSLGASGSGLFDMQGHLVGVASWKVGRWDGVLFYVNVNDVRTFLAR